MYLSFTFFSGGSAWNEHGDSTFDCCTGIRGNANGDPNDDIDVADLTYLADYLFGSRPIPPCYEGGNIDGSGAMWAGDLVYLVDYLYQGGPPPPACL